MLQAGNAGDAGNDGKPGQGSRPAGPGASGSNLGGSWLAPRASGKGLGVSGGYLGRSLGISGTILKLS